MCNMLQKATEFRFLDVLLQAAPHHVFISLVIRARDFNEKVRACEDV